jgi:hypothetical protein
MSVINDYDSWKKHYAAMIDGKILPNQKIFVVNDSTTQSGKGLQVVTAAAQKDNMSRSIINKAIKSSKKKKSPQSRSKHRSKNTKTRQTKKKVVRRRR